MYHEHNFHKQLYITMEYYVDDLVIKSHNKRDHLKIWHNPERPIDH